MEEGARFSPSPLSTGPWGRRVRGNQGPSCRTSRWPYRARSRDRSRRSKGEHLMAEQERAGVTTMRGNPLTLIGPALKPGDKAPDFQCAAQDLSPVSLASSAGKTRL